MIQNVLSDIGGIGLYGVLSVCLFFLAFTGMVLRACLLKRSHLDSMRSLPLQEDAPRSATHGETPHERE